MKDAIWAGDKPESWQNGADLCDGTTKVLWTLQLELIKEGGPMQATTTQPVSKTIYWIWTPYWIQKGMDSDPRTTLEVSVFRMHGIHNVDIAVHYGL